MYIYGAGNIGKYVLKIIKTYYTKQLIKIEGFIDREKKGSIAGIPVFSIDDIDRKSQIIIAIQSLDVAIEINEDLKNRGYKDIWRFIGRWKKYGKNFVNETCISCIGWKGIILPQVEMHIMDACNLNCRGCTHFAPIFVMDEPDIKVRLDDVSNFSKKFGHIIRFVILGGEPFLNKNIGIYVKEIRKILPNTMIEIVTNGLLLPGVSDEVLKVIKTNDVRISISEYAPTHKKIDEIMEKLDRNAILYEIRGFDKKQKFNIPLSLTADSIHKKLCISDGCITIRDGKMARCPTLMYIRDFNKKFGTNFPDGGIIDMSDEISGTDLLKKFKERVPLCDYCVQNEVDWSVCGKDVKCEDFAIDE